MRAPRHLELALERFFPGVKLQWQPRLQWWVLTDGTFYEDGTPARTAYYPTVPLLRGIEPWDWTTRRPVLFVGVIETMTRQLPSLFAILESLRKFYSGAKTRMIEQELDRIEAKEESEQAVGKARERDRMREQAKESFARFGAGRCYFGNGIRSTPASMGKALDREYARRELEQYGELAAEADREVSRRVREGAGISMTPRSPTPVVT